MKTAQGAPAQEEERIAASVAYIQHTVAGRHLCSAVQQLRQRFAVSCCPRTFTSLRKYVRV